MRKRVQTPAATTPTEERTESKELPEKKNPAQGLMPSFQDREAEDIPRLPRLSSMAVRVSGCQNSLTSALSDADPDKVRRERGEIRRSRMSQEDREQYYGLIAWARSDAVTTLSALALYDEALTTEQADALMAVAEIITAAEVIKP